MIFHMHDKKFTNLSHINITNTDFNKFKNLNSELKKAQHKKKFRFYMKILMIVLKIISFILIMNKVKKT